jgi:hypothetical protein
MARLQFDSSIGCGDIFVPDQFFAFDSIVLHADPTGHLGHIENFPPGQTIKFGSLEYIADARGDLVISGWTWDQLQNPLTS